MDCCRNFVLIQKANNAENLYQNALSVLVYRSKLSRPRSRVYCEVCSGPLVPLYLMQNGNKSMVVEHIRKPCNFPVELNWPKILRPSIFNCFRYNISLITGFYTFFFTHCWNLKTNLCLLKMPINFLSFAIELLLASTYLLWLCAYDCFIWWCTALSCRAWRLPSR